MSSIILHLCIGNEVKKRLNLSDKFIYGALLPDILRMSGIQRNETHYITKYIDGVFEVPDLEKYLNENLKDIKENDVKLGYYAHLLQDKIWYNHYVIDYVSVDKDDNSKIKFLNDGKIYELKDYTSHMYNDFSRLDMYIIEKYNVHIEKIKEKLLKFTEDSNIQRIIDESLSEKVYVKKGDGFFLNESGADKYIDECVEETVKAIKEIKR